MLKPVSGSLPRIEAIDVARGVALAMIFFVHMHERFLASNPTRGMFGRNVGPFNTILSVLDPLVGGAGFAIFSILFGLGFYMMISSADSKGTPFRARFLWRLAILLVIGYVNALFFRGDILTTYAILGALLILFYKASNRTIALVIAFILLGIPQYILYSVFGGEPMLAGSGLSASTPLNKIYHAAVTKGSFTDVLRSNVWDGHVWFSYVQFDVIGRAYLALCYFLVGLWLGRVALFQRLEELAPRIKRAFYISLALLIPSMAITGFVGMQALKGMTKGFQMNSWMAVMTIVATNITFTVIAALVGSGVLLAYRTARGQRMLGTLAPYGRMALTFYVVQSIIGTFLFYHWGLGRMAKLQHTHVALIAAVLIVVQAMLSAVWMRYFHYGPLEWIWRSATYMQPQPMLKTDRTWLVDPASEGTI